MSNRIRSAVFAVAAVISFAAPARAQQRPGLMGELMKDVNDVQVKLVWTSRCESDACRQVQLASGYGECARSAKCIFTSRPTTI